MRLRFWATLLLLGSSAVQSQTDTFAGRVREGNRLMEAGRYAEAAAVYNELAATHPRDPGLLANLGMALHLAGRDAEAVRQLETALKLAPANPPALVMLGGSYLKLGNPAKALAVLEKAAALAPDLKEAHQMLGETLAALGRQDEAAREFERWKNLDRRDPRAWYQLGRCYNTLAREESERIRQAAPESGYMLALVGRDQQFAAQYRSAFHLYREALSREPAIRGVHLAIAEIYAATGHPDWAAAEKARERALGEPDCSLGSRSSVRSIWGKFEEAAATSSNPSLEVRYWRVRALTELAREANRHVAELGESVEAHAIRAAAERDRGRTADSIRNGGRHSPCRPATPRSKRNWPSLFRLHEDYEGARTWWPGS